MCNSLSFSLFFSLVNWLDDMQGKSSGALNDSVNEDAMSASGEILNANNDEPEAVDGQTTVAPKKRGRPRGNGEAIQAKNKLAKWIRDKDVTPSPSSSPFHFLQYVNHVLSLI